MVGTEESGGPRPAAPGGDSGGDGGDTPSSKGERTRARLLDIAVEHFGSSGYRATSVSEICRAAGLTQAASYTYFDSKEHLFREAVDADAGALIREATTQVDAAGIEPRQLVPSLLLFLSGSLDRHPLTARVLRGLEPDATAQLIDLPAVHDLGGLVADGIRRGQRDGTVRADLDADVVGAGAEALLLGLVISLALGGGATTERHAFGVVSAFDAMLRPCG